MFNIPIINNFFTQFQLNSLSSSILALFLSKSKLFSLSSSQSDVFSVSLYLSLLIYSDPLLNISHSHGLYIALWMGLATSFASYLIITCDYTILVSSISIISKSGSSSRSFIWHIQLMLALLLHLEAEIPKSLNTTISKLLSGLK